MITPKSDNRTIADILDDIKRKSEFYTPEWRPDFENPDGGAALAVLFSEMLYDTIDRYNRFPDKCYIEFLNLIGAGEQSVSSAAGIAQAKPVTGAPGSVYIKGGTQLFKDVPLSGGDSTRVIFETDSGFFVTPAEIREMYMVDPERDIISRTEAVGGKFAPCELFNPDISDNVERHCFLIENGSVLSLSGASEICIRMTNSDLSYESGNAVSKLCSGGFAGWSYFNGTEYVPLKAYRKGTDIVLKKDGTSAICSDNRDDPEGRGKPALRCEMTADGVFDEINFDSVLINSRSLSTIDSPYGAVPDHLFANDSEISVQKGGYCFGKEPFVYDSFYICCSKAFSKKGASVSLEFTIGVVTVQDNTLSDEDSIEFNSKLLVNKDDAVQERDDVYISEVIWEYWNGAGWAMLDVTGSVNPFSCLEGKGRHTVNFICPQDMSESVQNAYSGLWIRARIKEIQNRYSTRARMFLPHIEGIRIMFDYGDTFLPAERITAWNNCAREVYENCSSSKITLFRVFPEKKHALYFRFDKEPCGYPINLYFDFASSAAEDRVIVFEYLCGSKPDRYTWCELKSNDKTNGFENSGIVSLYTPKDFAETELFGVTGFWIRAVNRSMRFNKRPKRAPILKAIIGNVIEITNKQTVSNEKHTVEAGKPNSGFKLINTPVIDCDLWVNELGESPLPELEDLEKADKTNVRRETDSSGQLTAFYVKWQPISPSNKPPSDGRFYSLDCKSGSVRFGDGISGKIPSYGSDAGITVNYSYGGGSLGNLPAGSIEGMIFGIPFVDSITNIIPTCGGSDGLSIDDIRKIGTKRLRHFGKAVTADDYENIVRERFSEIRDVKCFANRDKDCRSKSGFITVVVMPKDFGNTQYSLSLCRRIKNCLSGISCCVPLSGRRLEVIPAVPISISAEITAQIKNYDRAAQTEQEIIRTVNRLIENTSDKKIGIMPRKSDFFKELQKTDNVSYISGVVLVGEYYKNGEKITVSLDDAPRFDYLVAESGSHIIKL